MKLHVDILGGFSACSRATHAKNEPLPRAKTVKDHRTLVLSSRVQQKTAIYWLVYVLVPFICLLNHKG
jgi:hypothetical protein